MAEIVSLTEIASIINDELNSLTEELYNNQLINRNIKFDIHSQAMDYLEDKEYTEDVLTPGLITRLNSPFAASQDYTSYVENIQLGLYAFYYDKDDLTYIFGEYAKRNSGKWYRIDKDTDKWVYSAGYQLPNMNNRVIDEEERINMFMNIRYDFLLNGYVKDDLDIYISVGGSEYFKLPYESYKTNINKEKVTSDKASNPGKVTTRNTKTARTKEFVFIFEDNQVFDSIYSDIVTGDFRNIKYSINERFYNQGTEQSPNYKFDTTTHMTLTNGTISTTEGALLRINCTFEPIKE